MLLSDHLQVLRDKRCSERDLSREAVAGECDFNAKEMKAANKQVKAQELDEDD